MAKKKTKKTKTRSATPTFKNIRSGLVELLNKLNNISRDTDDITLKRRLRKLRRILNALLDEVVREEIKKNTPAYRTALKRLSAADAAAKQAVKDVKKIADTIKKAVSAAKAVDRVVKVFGDLAM